MDHEPLHFFHDANITPCHLFKSAQQISHDTSIPLETDVPAGGESGILGPVYPAPEGKAGGGLFGWFSGSNIVNKVVEKTKVTIFYCAALCTS